jgi:hypothetical protein
MKALVAERLAGRPAALLLSGVIAAGCLGVCGIVLGAEQSELDWARSALARNGTLEVVSADAATGILTVRVKSTGELRQVRADDVIGSLPGGGGHESAHAGSSTATRGQHVIASGPGYTIAAAGPATAAGANAASGAASGAEQNAAARNLPIERRHEPIICQGSRLLHIDGRNLEFDGDAVTAEKGCELHITNSSITAKGIGVAARDASVHIDNSFISGSGGSIDASDGAQVYARSSTFRGLIRRNDTAAFHDLGGNVGD